MRVSYSVSSALAVVLTVCLLVMATPTAVPALVTFAKHSERDAVIRLRNSELLAGVRRGLTYGSDRYWRLSNKLAPKSTPRREKENIPQLGIGVAAYINPAPIVIDAPTNMTVTATSNSSISLSWTAPAGSVNNYQVERTQSVSGTFSIVGSPTATTFNDTTVSSGNAYLYRVRAVSGGIPSTPSNMAVGTAITYTDNPLSVGVTQIKAVHVSELRQSVNAVRSVAGLSAASWTDTSLPGVVVKAVHVQEMRDKLGEALAALSVPITSYTDPVLTVGTTLVKKVHIDELRQRASASSSTSSGPMGGDLSTARLDPLNRTGSEDPLSRNFNWSAPLVSLPGRTGLNLGLSLSYNSLATWTKSGSLISFNDDHGFPAPGFRLGFPIIQAAFYNSEAGKNSFLMIAPSGSRVELRQVGTSNLYQSVDSSYLLLDSSTMVLKTAEGSQISYAWLGSDFQCTQIKDRNGNFITVNYDASGRIDKIVDTLAREVKFNYNGNDLVSITQTWSINGQQQPTHTWATFTYANQTIQTNFPGLSVSGPQNGSTIRVLTRLSLPDNSHFDFDYTTWGQVWKVRNYATATNDHLANYRSYNLPVDNTTAWTDCPRFTQRRDWASNWNRNQSGVEQEVVTTFAVPTSSSWTLPGGTGQTGMVGQVTQPDLTYHKIYFAGTAGTSTGWQRGLTSLVETYDSADVRQRQSVTTWTQDDPASPSLLNPRVIETNIYDPSGNRARTRVDYASFNLLDGTTCRYPQDTYEYAANATSVLRRTHLDYQMSSTYTTRRILGLTSAKYVCDGAQGEVPCNDSSGTSLLSKMTFQYDESGSVQGNDAPVQHDNANYTASFVAGRGNLSSASRHDVIVTGQVTTSTLQYNTAGAVVKTIDPAGHPTQMSYADAFAANGTNLDGGLPLTLAYPTTMTDAGGYTATTRYNYQFGAVTWKRSPQPNTTDNLPGPEQKITYDSSGRTDRVTSLANNAYTQYFYGPNYVQTFMTVNTVANEAHSIQVFDGLGRAIAKASNHPGSVGGFSGQLTVYDVMGRVIKRSNQTETAVTISGAPIQPYNWVAAGDDAQAGWLYAQTTYDWKGRALVTTNTDTSTKSTSYTGCGCAGGEILTVQDEGTIVSGELKRRTQKVYSDALGRQWKTEILNWDGTVYSTTVNVYNAHDQVSNAKQYVGPAPAEASSTNPNASCPTGTCQESVMTYDGFGRLKTRHLPEQQVDPENPASTDHTTWTYKPDDALESITDARGASATYSYNSRHLRTGITYSVPVGSSIPVTPSATFEYDAARNRTSMLDGSGSHTYVYDQLSRMTSETQAINGLSGSFSIGYSYNLAGKLATITDPQGRTVTYGYDTAARLNNVSGSGYNTSPFVDNFQYRAWGALKHYTHRFDNWNGATAMGAADLTYNARTQLTSFVLANPFITFPQTFKSDYQYHPDGRVKFISNRISTLDSMFPNEPPQERDHHFDRGYVYDHAARLTIALTGDEARGGTIPDGPYKQTYQYDVWDHMTTRVNRIWSKPLDTFIANYINNRNQDQFSLWRYDADGKNTRDDNGWTVYDAEGSKSSFPSSRFFQPAGSFGPPNWNPGVANVTYDGDGQLKKQVETYGGGPFAVFFTTYHVRSTVLQGAPILWVEAQTDTGTWAWVTRIASIYAEGNRIAFIRVASNTIETSTNGNLIFEHSEPLTGVRTGTWGGVIPDPLGQDIPSTDPGPEESGDVGDYPEPHQYGNADDPGLGCELDGITIDCGTYSRFLNSGSLATRWNQVNPNGTITPRTAPIIPLGLGIFKMWVPDGARGNDNQYSVIIGVIRIPQKTLCDHLEDALWTLYKSHNNEVGSNYPGSKAGKTLTNCYLYAQNVLTYAYEQMGQKDIADKIRGLKDENGKPQSGTALAKFLVGLGWKTHYWNPDVKNPRGGAGEHPWSYRVAQKTGNYYGIHVDNYIINYRKNTPGEANDPAGVAAFNEFSKERFAFGLANGGVHNFMDSNGMIFEVHWSESDPAKLYERSDFYNYGASRSWQSGIFLTPPCK